MLSGNLQDWVFWLTGALLALAGLTLAAWALFWDRSRGRKRCPRCWYSMEGLPGTKCPECGLDTPRPRALLRTRRRWGLAALGVICCGAGYGTTVWQRVHTRGWIGAVPTWTLIAALPWSESGGANPDGTYRTRGKVWLEVLEARALQMGGLNAAALVRLSVRGDSARPVCSPDWMSSYGNAYVALDQRGLVGEAQQRALWTALVPATFKTRARWPRGATVWLEDRPLYLDWLERFVQCDRDRRVVIRIVGSNQDLCHREIHPRPLRGMTTVDYLGGWRDGNRSLDLSALPNGPLRADMVVADALPYDFVGPAPENYRLWQTVVTLPICIEGELHDVIQPVRSVALDDAVRSGIRAGVLPYELLLSVSPECRAAFKGVALAITIEAWVGGRVVATARAWDGPGWAKLDSAPIQWSEPRELPELDPSEPGFEIRVRGNGAVALRDFSATRYWDGEVVIRAEKTDSPWRNLKATPN